MKNSSISSKETYSVQKDAAPLTSSIFGGRAPESGVALAAERRCSECGHSLHRHVALPNPEVAKWLRLIHRGCPNCEECADE
jgi:hypothetical protein